MPRVPQQHQQDFSVAEQKIAKGYESIKLKARLLGEEIESIFTLTGTLPDIKETERISNLQAIRDGYVNKAVASSHSLSVREVARAITSTPFRCKELIVEDFEAIVHWGTSQNPPMQPDNIREKLVKRRTLLEAALPDSMKQDSQAAMAQIEREHLQKTYVNSETMLGDDISEIPKPNFFVSEDNYAWDMDELAQAITANDGVMRNPLSRQMFSPSDIRLILAHPLGQRLRPLQLAQSQLRNGARPATIQKVMNLGAAMTADQSSDALPSRLAIEEFQAYVATLPDSEQRTIDSLRIPAVDSFNGQPFDYTIGESVRDAVANTTCFHKVGNFLTQAATYLQRQ